MNHRSFFPGKVIVITGSSRGIGREVARMALGAGARVVLNGREASSLELTRAQLGTPERSLAVAADVSQPEGASRLIQRTLTVWGRIDVLINNAGLSMRGRFEDLSPLAIRTMVDANFLSAVFATQAALSALRQSRGRVLFVSSLAGLRGFAGVSLYSATKMALTALHQSLQTEEGPGGVTSGLVYLPFTENDAEKTTIGADGKPFRHQRRWAITQQVAAQAILRTAAATRPELVLTTTGKLFALMNRVFPRLTHFIVLRSKGSLHSVIHSVIHSVKATPPDKA